MRTFILSILSLLFVSSFLQAEVKTKEVEYSENGVTLKGFMAWEDSAEEKRPGVLVVHEWWGINDHVRGRAKQLAELGYTAFALDMYGAGETTDHPEKASGMMEHLKKNEDLLLSRANAGLKILREDSHTDPDKIAAVGYCFAVM